MENFSFSYRHILLNIIIIQNKRINICCYLLPSDQQSDSTFLLDSVCCDFAITNHKLQITNLQVLDYTSEKGIDLPPAYARSAFLVNKNQISATVTAKQPPYVQYVADNVAPLLDIEVDILIGMTARKH